MTDNPLLILAVDQRPWLTKQLFGHTHGVTMAERAITTEAKHMVLEALIAATNQESVPGAGILVDAELGPGVAERARHAGLQLIIPVEKAGLKIYETEFPDLKAHLQHYQPDQVKVLVRYSPEDPEDERAIQRERLAEVSRVSAELGLPFLFELLVNPVSGDPDDEFEARRSELTTAAMAEIGADMNVDIWKIESQGDLAGYQAAQAKAEELGGTCVLLGAGRPLDVVRDWIKLAGQAGFKGFAVGRTLWWDSVNAYQQDPATRASGVAEISRRYLECVSAFRAGQRV